MASRRKSRELALQMLFQWEVGKHSPAHVVSTFLKPKEIDAPENTFARDLFQGTVNEIPAIDPILREHARNWKLERMAAVDRNVLRLALFEMLHHTQTPPAVVINEALEIARRFSGEDSAEFVNGILDAVHKAMPSQSPPLMARSAEEVPPTPSTPQRERHSKKTRKG